MNGQHALLLQTAARVARGFGAAGDSPSALTMQAAQNLDQHLVTNGCAGCDDLKSPLRQLTFAFKAAFLSDPATQNTPAAASMNMSSLHAMTAYGVATNSALTQVLGATRQSEPIPCTDDNGNCLGNFATPIVPPSAKVAVDAAVMKIPQLLSQMGGLFPQGDVVAMLKSAFDSAMTALAVYNVQPAAQAAASPPVVVVQPAPAPAPAPVVVAQPAPAPTTSVLTKVLIGGLVGSLLVGGGMLAYRYLIKE